MAIGRAYGEERMATEVLGTRADRDQARTIAFRGALVVQLLAAGFFGLAPLVAPAEFAKAFSLAGSEPYLIRLAGAAAIGYAAAAILGLVRSSWTSLRIPIFATFVFNTGAFAACLVTIDESGLAPLPVLVGAAAALFLAIAAYWLYRDEGFAPVDPTGLEAGFRVTLVLGIVAATTIALWQLLLPRGFAGFFGLATGDLVIIRL